MEELLLQNKLFAGLTAADITAATKCLECQTEHYDKGAFLALAEHTAPRMGILLTGKAKIVKETFRGDVMLINTLIPGDIFGETFACMDLPLMPLSVVATEPATALFFEVQRLIHTCESACPFHQRIIGNLLAILAAKNLAMNTKMSYLTHKTIRSKLQAYFYDQAEQAQSLHFTIPFNRNELADYLCIDRSAMCRELSKMQAESLLTYHKQTFHLKEQQ